MGTAQSLITLDYVVIGVYFATVLGIALWVSRKPKDRERTSEDFFLASRALPWWIIGTSLIASNISAEQMIGMSGTAFASGIAVVSYEWMAAATLLIVAKFFLPTFLEMKIYSMPDYLARRFDRRVSMGLGVFWLLVYVFVNLTSVLYLGALSLNTLLGMPIFYGVLALALFSAVYTIYGGLTAVAWTDFIQVAVLFFGGIMVTVLGLKAVGGEGASVLDGWSRLLETAPDRFHTALPWHHNDLPWIGVFFGGMWIANLSYWGFNQYITQRALAGRDLNQARLGLAFAALLKILIPVVLVVPGVIAFVLFADKIERPDMAYPTLIRDIVPPGWTGLVLAALIAAIVSSLNSMANSAATIFTMDIARPILNIDSERWLVRTGRLATASFLIIAVIMAPGLARFDQVFQYIQEYTGMVSPGVCVIFFLGLLWRRATSAAALTVAILTIPVAAGLKFLPFAMVPAEMLAKSYVPEGPLSATEAIALFINPFLNRMGIAFLILLAIGIVVSLTTRHAPGEAAEQAVGRGISYRTSATFNISAILLLGMLVALYYRFW